MIVDERSYRLVPGKLKEWQALYEKEGGPLPDPILKLRWPYADPDDPKADEIAREINGYAIEAVYDPADATKVLVEKGKQVAGFAQLRDDGSTASGCWIYAGCFNENGNNMARRDNSDPDDAGFYS